MIPTPPHMRNRANHFHGVWICRYCGKMNPNTALSCGEGKWDGCGAPKERIRRNLSIAPIETGTLRPSITGKPHGIHVEDIKLEIGMALLPVFEKSLGAIDAAIQKAGM